MLGSRVPSSNVKSWGEIIVGLLCHGMIWDYLLYYWILLLGFVFKRFSKRRCCCKWRGWGGPNWIGTHPLLHTHTYLSVFFLDEWLVRFSFLFFNFLNWGIMSFLFKLGRGEPNFCPWSLAEHLGEALWWKIIICDKIIGSKTTIVCRVQTHFFE